MSKLDGTKFPYKVVVTQKALYLMNKYAMYAQPTEIGGLARIQIDKDAKQVRVVDVAFMEQTSNSVHFQIESDAMAKWTQGMIKAGRAGELPEWCSLFHSHPVGCSPSMSGEDLEEIQKFASDESAFSLILTASLKGDSTRMAMHYCGRIMGEKYVIPDIPVLVEQESFMDQAKEYSEYILTKEKIDASKENINRLSASINTILRSLNSTEPFDNTYELNQKIKAHVKTLVNTKKPSWLSEPSWKTSRHQTIGIDNQIKMS